MQGLRIWGVSLTEVDNSCGRVCLALDLERLTQPIYEPRADDGSGQCEQSLVNIKPPFETNSELAKPSKPRMGAFDNPAVFS